MLKAQKVRLYPNREQKQIISSQIGGARYVYNCALALRKYAYTKFGIKDFLHKLSLQYSENQTVVVEDLKIKNMTSKTKGEDSSSKLTPNSLLKLVMSVVIFQKKIGNHKISLYVLLVGILLMQI